MTQTSAGAHSGQSRIGVLGLAVMGQNLARNIAHHGFPIAVYNRTTARTDEFAAAFGQEGAITPARTMQEFVAAIVRPRAVILMVQAGRPVDQVITELQSHLD